MRHRRQSGLRSREAECSFVGQVAAARLRLLKTWVSLAQCMSSDAQLRSAIRHRGVPVVREATIRTAVSPLSTIWDIVKQKSQLPFATMF